MNTVDEILDYAIDKEQQAADFYENLAGRVEKGGMTLVDMPAPGDQSSWNPMPMHCIEVPSRAS